MKSTDSVTFVGHATQGYNMINVMPFGGDSINPLNLLRVKTAELRAPGKPAPKGPVVPPNLGLTLMVSHHSRPLPFDIRIIPLTARLVNRNPVLIRVITSPVAGFGLEIVGIIQVFLIINPALTRSTPVGLDVKIGDSTAPSAKTSGQFDHCFLPSGYNRIISRAAAGDNR